MVFLLLFLFSFFQVVESKLEQSLRDMDLSKVG
jgi:hypothetical protein